MEMQYASNGKGNLGVTLGAIGTGLSIMNGGAGLLNLGGGMGNNQYVNKEAYDVQIKLIEAERNNAILAADLSSEKKMVDVYAKAVEHANGIRDTLQAQIHDLDKRIDANAASQAVINCGFSSNIGILQTQMEQVMGMTKLMIPNTNVYTPAT